MTAGEKSISGLAALRWGLASAWTSRRVILFIAGSNLVLALLALYPLLGPLDASLSRQPDASRIGREMDYRWWTDWAVNQSAVVGGSMNLLGAAGLLMVVASAFFSGGLLESLRNGPKHRMSFDPLPDPYYRGATPEWRAAAPGPASVQVFLRESARHFPIFLLLLALSLPLYWVVQRILNHGALLLLDTILEGVNDERVGILLTLLRAVLFVGAFHLVTVFFEYARANAVLRPGAAPTDVLRLPLRVLRARPGAFLLVEGAAVLLQLAAMLAYIPLDRALGWWPPLAATAGLVAAQAFLFCRLLIRAGAQGAQMQLAQETLSKKA